MKFFPVLISSAALIYAVLLMGGCANQLPPSGGEDDTTPPVVTGISPKPGTVNFKRNTIELEFDEYYDRRSFTEAFFITPKPKGEIEFSWGRTSVEIEFTKPLENNKTYLFVLGKAFKDNHNNALKEPVQFALSTGSRIDKAGISGKVSGKSMDKMYVFAYRLFPGAKDTLNPATSYADYYMPVSNDGTYKLYNLSAGDYRLFAVFDNDKNGIFDKEFDRISPPEKDVYVTDSLRADNVNFISQDIFTDESFCSRPEFLNTLKSDTAGFIYSNIQKSSITGTDHRYYFYFKNNKLTREQILDGADWSDTLGKKIRTVYKWLNDSLLEIVPLGIKYGTAVNFTFDLSATALKQVYKSKFTVADEKKCSEVTGTVTGKNESRAVVMLINKDNPEQNFSQTMTADSSFAFNGIYEGTYFLFAFIDSNSNGKFDRGSYFPFRESEKSFFYGQELSLKGGWKTENVIVNF